MTEIPLPPSEGYDEPEKKGGFCGGCNKVLCILVIAIVVVGGIVVVIMNSAPQYQTRVLNEWTNEDVDPHYIAYYRAQFSVSSSEVETGRDVQLHFQVTCDNGADPGSVTIYVRVYECSQATVDAAPTWDDLSSYFVSWVSATGSMDRTLTLENYAATYTWTIEFQYSDTKSSVWDSDATITLIYNRV